MTAFSDWAADLDPRREWERCVASGRAECGPCPGTCPVNKGDDELVDGDDLGDDQGDDGQGDGLGDDDDGRLDEGDDGQGLDEGDDGQGLDEGDGQGLDLDDDDLLDIAVLSRALQQGDDATPDEVPASYRSPSGSVADARDAARAEILARYRQLTEAEAGLRRLPWVRGRMH
jgi:hypothetical protein